MEIEEKKPPVWFVVVLVIVGLVLFLACCGCFGGMINDANESAPGPGEMPNTQVAADNVQRESLGAR